jgi:hypothetical protein
MKIRRYPPIDEDSDGGIFRSNGFVIDEFLELD